MKRTAVSSGLIVLGACVVQAGSAYNLSQMQSSKPWSVSASLRGMYDDNYTTSSSDEQDSYGFTVSPTASINLPLEQTLLTASYSFDARYFEARDDGENEPWDFSHQFDLSMLHSFSERYTINVRDSFVVAQEPGLIDPNLSTPQRTEGDNIRNYANVELSIQLTPLWGVVLSYGNAYYNYEDQGAQYLLVPPFIIPSRSGVLDRMEHSADVKLQRVLPNNTVVFLGYGFGAVSYIHVEDIGLRTVGPNPIRSDDRNNYSHRGYLGASHAFNQSLSGSIQGGVRYTDPYNDPVDSSSHLNPDAAASLSYKYARGSAELSFNQSINQTDEVSSDGSGRVTLFQQTSVLFGQISYNITPKLTGKLSGFGQFSTFEGGAFDGETDKLYGVDAGLSYNFTKHFFADCGYHFTTVDSGLTGRGYDRNIFTLGVTAVY